MLSRIKVPATLAASVVDPAPGKMTVVFATYQSIQTVSDAQLKHGMGRFDLIICDEAHRTTGATIDGQEESNFVKVHNDAVVDLHRFCSGHVLMLGGPLFEGHW